MRRPYFGLLLLLIGKEIIMENKKILMYYNLLPWSVQVHSFHASGYIAELYKCAKQLNLFPDLNDIHSVERALETGALLHDLGKIIFSAYILNGKQKLDEFEWFYMRRHPAYAAHLIERDFSLEDLETHEFKVLINIIKYHHERWDGKGYPYGLLGAEIPAEAQLCSVADAFDAMTTDRSYKKSISPHQAFEVMLEESGRQFSPASIECLSAARESMLERYRMYQEIQSCDMVKVMFK